MRRILWVLLAVLLAGQGWAGVAVTTGIGASSIVLTGGSSTIDLIPPLNTITLTTTAVDTDGTVDPSISLVAGCPHTPSWNWGDGSADSTGTSVSHTYSAAAGTKTITLTLPDAGRWLEKIDVSSDKITGGTLFEPETLRQLTSCVDFRAGLNAGLSASFALSDIPAITYLYMFNTNSTITGAISDLNTSMTYLSLYGSNTTITGALADLPAGITYFSLYNTSSIITGALADLSPNMGKLIIVGGGSEITGALADLSSNVTYLSLSGTGSVITGGATAVPTGITDIDIASTGCTAANLDDVLLRLYTDRAAFIHSTPVLNIGGTNPDPNGTYQDGDPPTTGLEYAYELVNDPETEGFYPWTITY